MMSSDAESDRYRRARVRIAALSSVCEWRSTTHHRHACLARCTDLRHLKRSADPRELRHTREGSQLSAKRRLEDAFKYSLKPMPFLQRTLHLPTSNPTHQRH
jgi:hypothetical protein